MFAESVGYRKACEAFLHRGQQASASVLDSCS